MKPEFKGKQEFASTWPSYFMLDKLRLMVDKYARMDRDTLTITYKVRDYHTHEFEKQGRSREWVEKTLSKEEAQQIFLDLYPDGTLVES